MKKPHRFLFLPERIGEVFCTGYIMDVITMAATAPPPADSASGIHRGRPPGGGGGDDVHGTASSGERTEAAVSSAG